MVVRVVDFPVHRGVCPVGPHGLDVQPREVRVGEAEMPDLGFVGYVYAVMLQRPRALA